jgi:hypothetical protein
VKITVKGAVPFVGEAENWADAVALMYAAFVLVFDPPGPVAVSATV